MGERNERSVYPEHFHRAVEHGLALAGAGAPPSMLSVMSRGFLSRGFVDAAEGYSHARLRLTVAALDMPAAGQLSLFEAPHAAA